MKLANHTTSVAVPNSISQITNLLVAHGVRVERLNEINEEDARAEGVMPDPFIDVDHPRLAGTEWKAILHMKWNPIGCFIELWDSINAKSYPWWSNQWVWVIAFKRMTDAAGGVE
ncbi:MAG: hypothetical protein PSV22_19785 [Pseudolabrys sp.]|nr:hypothetical protein [Pseudolabrys sp.]